MSRGAELVRTGLRGIGQTLITAGVIVLLFVVYELQVTGVVAARAQDRLGDELEQSWSEAPRQPVAPPVEGEPTAPPTVPTVATPDLGDAFARLHVPALDGYASKNVVEGVSVEDLKQGGPGHIPGTALPGEVGNVVLSGHRTTYGAPFNRWDELAPGDLVVLETRDGWFTYQVTGSQIVLPNAVEVTYPVPGDRDATPTRPLLTMTTCHPEYSARERLIVSAELTASDDKAAGPPAALQSAG